MSFVTGLECRECGQDYPTRPLYVCENCFGPLEVMYDYDGIKNAISRDKIAARDRNLWRYRELLPIDGDPSVGLYSGFTPLVRAHRLGQALGVKELYLKDDSVNHPTFSYKDRVVSVAISKAIEFGFDTVSCASTGNLANSVSAHAAKAGLNCYVFIPDGLEQGKIIGSAIYGPKTVAIKGNYDDVNRLCSEIGDKYGWAFVNVNLRPYYSEGAKTHGFEVAEQLGWKLPPTYRCGVGRRNDSAETGQRFSGVDQSRSRRRHRLQNLLGASRRLRADHQRLAQRHGPGHSGKTAHHRQLHRHRQPR